MTEKEVPYEKLKEGYMQLLTKNKSLKQNLEKSQKNCEILQNGIAERDQMIEVRNKSISELISIREDLNKQIQSYKSQIESLEQSNLELEKNQTTSVEQKPQEPMSEELIQEFNNERRQLHKQIEELKNEISQKSEQLGAITTEKDSLNFSYISSQNEITNYKLQISNLTEQINNLENEKVSQQKSIESLQKFKESAQKVLQSSGEAQSQIITQLEKNDQLQKEISLLNDKYNTDITQIKRENKEKEEKFNEIIQKLTNETNLLKNDNDNLRNNINNMQDLLNEKDKKIIEFNSLITGNSDLKTKLEQHEKVIDSLNQVNSDLQNQIQIMNQRNEALQADVAKLMSEKKRIDQLLIEKDSIINEMTQKIDKMRENDKQQAQQSQLKLQMLEKEKQTFDDQLSSYKTKNDELSKIIQIQSDELIPLRSENESYKVRIASLDNEIELRTAAEAEKKILSEENSNLKEERKVLKEELINYHKILNELNNTKEELEETKLNLENANKQNELDQESFEKRENQLNEIIQSLEKTDNEKNSIISSLSLSNQNLQDQIDENMAKLSLLKDLEIKHKDIQEKFKILENKLKESEETLEEEKLKVSKYIKSNKQLEIAKNSSDKKIQILDEEILSLKKKIYAIEKDRGQVTTIKATTALFPDYIRKVLLQFFTKDASEREALIPVILKLVSCTDDQITAAQRCYAESNQVISQAFSFFKGKK